MYTKTAMNKFNYGSAILSGFEFLLENYPETFVIGQGLWSPWYVGNSMTNLEKKYGTDRIIDTPVSESATTGAAVGASLAGMKPIIVHPRMDFMLYAVDSIVNQAAKWSHMFGGQSNTSVTFRAIINRGGEQGAQHSQALHAWFAHIPGLKVVMPSTVKDARDLLIASVLSDDPVMYIDDRWLYEQEDFLPKAKEVDLNSIGPIVDIEGKDITIVASGHSSLLARNATKLLVEKNVFPEVIDIRLLNPLDIEIVLESVKKTNKLLVLDSGWGSCGFSAEIITKTVENISPRYLDKEPVRLTLPPAPAPTASILEDEYYLNAGKIVDAVNRLLFSN